MVDSAGWTGMTPSPRPPRPPIPPPIPVPPEMKRARWLFLAAAGALAAYTILIGKMSPSSAHSLAQGLSPITDLMGIIIPSVASVQADLVARGFPDRAVIVGHAYAMQWLFALVALLLPIPDFWRSRAYLKADRERARALPGARRVGWRFRIGLALFLALFMAFPFFGISHTNGRRGFDLALSNTHLFERLFLFAGWLLMGVVMLVVAVRFISGPEDPPRPESISR